MPDRAHRRFPQAAQAKAKLGQNFLVSPTAPRAIVDALGSLAGRTVVEIGSGKGAITGLLAVRAQRVIAVELDRSLAAALSGALPAPEGNPGSDPAQPPRQPSVEVLCRDILSVDLTALAGRLGTRLLIAGNLPYYITSPILLHLFAHSAVIDRAVLMAQREVAERVVASPGSRDYGLLSATTQLHAAAEILFTLPPGVFLPPPTVDSAVFRLVMRPRFAELSIAPESFLPFLQSAFAQKRKTLANNLRAAGYSAEAVAAALNRNRINPQIRAEAMPLDAMALVFRALETEAP